MRRGYATLEELYANPEPSFCCKVLPGQPHADGCSHACCMWTGGQLIACAGGIAGDVARVLIKHGEDELAQELCYHLGVDDVDHDCGLDIWLGWSRADEAAIRYGLFSYFGPDYGEKGWVSCGPEHPNATPDLNAVAMMKWNREEQKYERW